MLSEQFLQVQKISSRERLLIISGAFFIPFRAYLVGMGVLEIPFYLFEPGNGQAHQSTGSKKKEPVHLGRFMRNVNRKFTDTG